MGIKSFSRARAIHVMLVYTGGCNGCDIEIVNSILEKYNSIINTCKSEYRDDFNSRAEAADYFKQCKFPAVMFAIYDCKEYRPIVWKYV